MGWAIATPRDRRLSALAAGFLLTFSMAAPAAADDPQPLPAPEASELALEGVGKLMRALELFMQSIPAYGQPFVDEDGNIVIPRLEDPEGSPGMEPPVDETGTTT
jgi:hypothetical protein